MALLRKAVIKQEVEIIVSIVFDVMLDSEIFYNYLPFTNALILKNACKKLWESCVEAQENEGTQQGHFVNQQAYTDHNRDTSRNEKNPSRAVKNSGCICSL